MKTAGFLKISGVHSAKNVVDYNLQTRKTRGFWRNQIDNPLYQSDLVSFHDNSNLIGLNIQQKGGLLVHQIMFGMQVAHSSSPNLKQHKNWTQARTLIQSFQFGPNRQLKPQTVHQMGNELYEDVKAYLYHQYNYRLDNGLVSTHIDRNDVEDLRAKRVNGHPIHFKHVPDNIVRYPHLHNHIVIPSYNMSGKPIYPYLRKRDIYQMQAMNNMIVSSHGLNDYYFNQLYQSIHPSTAVIGKKQRKYNEEARRMSLPNIRRSNIQVASKLFNKANDYAWDKDKPLHNNTLTITNFAKTRRDRNDYLIHKFAYRTKRTKDIQTKKPQVKFTSVKFQGNAQQRQWINILNMRLLRWHDRDQMRAERILSRFNFSEILNVSVSHRDFDITLGASIARAVSSPNSRSSISIFKTYQTVIHGKSARKNGISHGKIRVMTTYGKQLIHSTANTEFKSHKSYSLAHAVCLYSDMCYKAQKKYTNKRTQGHQIHKSNTKQNTRQNGRAVQSREALEKRQRQQRAKNKQRSQQTGPEL